MSQDLLADLDGYYQASSANGGTRLAVSGQRQDTPGTTATELRSARHGKAIRLREPRPVPENGNEVLFDATAELSGSGQDDDEDDEFGDFQSGSGNERHDRAAAPGMVDTTTDERPLLDLDLDVLPSSKPERTIPGATAAKGLEGSLADMTLAAPAFLDEQARRPPGSPARKSDAVPGIWASDSFALPDAAGDDDGWGDFMGGVPSSTSPKGSGRRESIKAMATSACQDAPVSLIDINAAASSQTSMPSSAQTIETPARPDPSRPLSPPPTTIPPPSVLLPLFPSLLRLRGNGNAGEEIHSLFENLTVAAYILAGRRLRWKRDPFLSQSTKIGPASSSGRAGGMKLTGVDKAESLKEEREVAEVIDGWRREVGTARARVAAAAVVADGNVNVPGDGGGVGVGLGISSSSAPTARPRVPDLSPTMLVINIHTPHKQSDKPSSGFVGPGSRASKERCCALCGLTRHERVKGIDYQDEHRGYKAAGSLPATNPSATTTPSTLQSSTPPANAAAASSSSPPPPSLPSSLPPPAPSVGLSEIDAILGDWWIEPWGHSVCRKFWYRWRDRLRSR